MSETRRFTAEDFKREAVEGFDAFGPDFTPTSNMLEQAAESERVLREIREWTEQPTDGVLGFDDGVAAAQGTVRAILGRVKP